MGGRLPGTRPRVRGWRPHRLRAVKLAYLGPQGTFTEAAVLQVAAPGDEPVPLASVDVFIDQSLEEAVAHLDPKRYTLFRQLAEQGGLRITKVTQEIQAVPAPAAIARALKIPPRAPCLRVLRCYFAENDFLFELSASHHPGDRFAYAMHIDVDQ